MQLVITWCSLIFFSICCTNAATASKSESDSVIVILGTNKTKDDNYRRCLQSARANKIKPIMIKPINLKIQRNLVLKTLNGLAEDALVLYGASAEEMIFAGTLDVIRNHFLETNTSILFAGSKDSAGIEYTEEQFPKIVGHGLRFLSSQVIMGYAGALIEVLSNGNEDQVEWSDQEFFVDAYLNQPANQNMKIDHYCEVFQWITGENTQMNQEDEKYTVLNDIYWTEGPILLAKGALGNILLNRYTDYLNNARTRTDKKLKLKKPFPTVTFGVIIYYRTPFLTNFLDKVQKQNYPKDQINLILINANSLNEDLSALVEDLSTKYASVQYLTPFNQTRAQVYELALEEAKKLKNSFYFCLDSQVHLDNSETLMNLVSLNKTVISPIVSRPGEMWSNFWGDIQQSGFYKRSFDYFNIVKGEIKGIWNVPYITNAYLIKKHVLPKVSYTFKENWFNLGEKFQEDSDMMFANNLLRNGIHMFASNLDSYGHLIHIDDTNFTLGLPNDLFEFYELKRNPTDWAKTYIHSAYWNLVNETVTTKFDEPCPDVFRFQIVTDKFCDDVIKIMENFGQWSSGSHSDERLANGYENVPTRDIHLRQVGLKEHWDEFMNRFVKPLQRRVFEGYMNEPPKSTMQFVVRYRPDEQPSLRPHNDASTYTISIALNNIGVDFEGGGTRFVRYDCSVLDSKKGQMILHPGRLTHHHEGLQTTKGTRYILVTFVDP